ncbi:hypothetical protein NDU88_001186 [Pleurodeles waltl]|uniref:Uncharacterized protein n=1 Tax=Pleurodeles waltl TaxID=8319 RepID=A0AAV7U7S1_PLEWA|nr:hypothetical protein NDU88_001186 [Pleurodeles waltl]
MLRARDAQQQETLRSDTDGVCDFMEREDRLATVTMDTGHQKCNPRNGRKTRHFRSNTGYTTALVVFRKHRQSALCDGSISDSQGLSITYAVVSEENPSL